MFRRLFWLVTGAGFGFGASFWMMRAVRQAAERYSPERVTGNVASVARGLGQDLRAAATEGRLAMREREDALRGEAGTGSRLLD